MSNAWTWVVHRARILLAGFFIQIWCGVALLIAAVAWLHFDSLALGGVVLVAVMAVGGFLYSLIEG